MAMKTPKGRYLTVSSTVGLISKEPQVNTTKGLTDRCTKEYTGRNLKDKIKNVKDQCREYEENMAKRKIRLLSHAMKGVGIRSQMERGLPPNNAR